MAAERGFEELQKKKKEHFRETADRLTAAAHIQTEYFAKHTKIEGYYESRIPGRFFGCDRLMKQDSMFGTIQLGYNPNRERVFLFANMKTSRYDTVASRYQKELKEYQQKALLKGNNENRAYISKGFEMASVLIEKRENKPWTRYSIQTYLGRNNMEAIQKTMPFFMRSEETEELTRIRKRRKEIQEAIREQREQQEEVRELRKEAVEDLTMENLTEAILIRKETAQKHFLRRLNYAYDFQKQDIEAYYREKRKILQETEEREVPEEVEPGDEKV